MENSFATLDLSLEMLQTLQRIEYKEMTPIQKESIPLILQGADIIAKAKTGSGKTAAFGIGIIEHLDPASKNIQAMVLTPTRELAEQVAQSLRTLAQHKENTKIVTLYGGVPLTPQARSLEKGAHIIVGTPGRIEDHLGKGTLVLSKVRTVVLDEADRMLDMGFARNVEAIVSHTSNQRQTLLFSATFPKDIATLSKRIQKEPYEIFIQEDAASQIKEHFFTTSNDKFPLVAKMLQAFSGHSAILFCNTKEQCHALADYLLRKQYVLKELHGELDQRERSEVLRLFTNKSIPILIATDIAARGLDIDEVAYIVNVDFPFKPEVYLHRVGRTGRMEHKGEAYSLINDKERASFETLKDYVQKSFLLDPFDVKALPKNSPAVKMQTLMLFGGKKKKLRKGDIIGSLCNACGIDAKNIGMIDIADDFSYVAIAQSESKKVLEFFKTGTIKNKKIKAIALS